MLHPACLQHPDLAPNMHPDIGLNTFDGTNIPKDEMGHGTHVSEQSRAGHFLGCGRGGGGGGGALEHAAGRHGTARHPPACHAASAPGTAPCPWLPPTRSTLPPAHAPPACLQVAGIIGARGNNGLGISGVNWRVNILGCKFMVSEQPAACPAQHAHRMRLRPQLPSGPAQRWQRDGRRAAQPRGSPSRVQLPAARQRRWGKASPWPPAADHARHRSLRSPARRAPQDLLGGYTSNAIACINFCIAKKAKIINASWGGGPKSQALGDAIAAAGAAGILWVGSAGNGGRDIDANPMYPPSFNYPHQLTVAATG